MDVDIMDVDKIWSDYEIVKEELAHLLLKWRNNRISPFAHYIVISELVESTRYSLTRMYGKEVLNELDSMISKFTKVSTEEVDKMSHEEIREELRKQGIPDPP